MLHHAAKVGTDTRTFTGHIAKLHAKNRVPRYVYIVVQYLQHFVSKVVFL